MNVVEPIRDPKKILAIKRNLKEEGNARNYLLFVAGVNLALRISDLLSLRVKDIIDKQGNIKEFIHLKERKTKRQVKIKLNDTVKEALNYFLDKARITDPEQYLFKSERGNRALDRVRSWGLIQKWIKEVGLEGERYGTHTLRKTWGYQARMQGVSIEKINEKLGHKSVIVTKRYIGINQEEINLLEEEICI
ncbi:site-specific integrase [Candidatus Atribacteria bacterium 1244-E10-H5-B2]|nr:MAG: site-specific integrase [Candidatus Atribacteria bacterium 1244-E10-H5-B2]